MSETIETAIEPKPKRKITNTELDEVKTYMVLEFGYDMKVCLPYADGAAIIAKLEKAERVEHKSYSSKNISFKPEVVQVNFQVLPQKDYRLAKMNLLLGVEDE